MIDTPLMWAKKLDMIPELGTQVLVGNGKLEIRQMAFEMKEKKRDALFVAGKPYMKLENGIILKPIVGSPDSVVGTFGSDDPRNEVVALPQKEIFDDLRNSMGDLGNINIIERMGVVPVSKDALKVNPTLQEIDDLWIAETRRGTKKEFPTSTGPMRLASYSRMVRAKLVSMDVPSLLTKNIRSGMLSKYIIGNDGILGWTDVLKKADVSIGVIDTVSNSWWEDTAIPEHVYSHSSGVAASTVNRSDILVKLKKSGVSTCFSWENKTGEE